MRRDAPGPEVEVSQETTVAVTLGGRALATGVPVSAGRVAVQVDQDVPERVSLTLPWEHEQHILDPTLPGAVLGMYGHRVEITTTLSDGARTWRLPLGAYLVTDWEADGAGIQVTAAGLMTHVKEHEAPAPRVLPARSPAVSEIMALLREDGLEPVVLPGVRTISVPAGFEAGTDRLATLQELAAAIPAIVRQSWDGSIHIRPALDERTLTPVMSWSDSEDGTVVTPASTGSRDGLYSHLVVPWSREVTTTDAEGDESTETEGGYVERTISAGILDARIFGHRTRTVEAGAITSHAQAQAVAENEAARAHLRARTEEVTMAVDWRAEIDDAVSLTTRSETVVGRITGLDLPLTTSDGDMVATIGIPA